MPLTVGWSIGSSTHECGGLACYGYFFSALTKEILNYLLVSG